MFKYKYNKYISSTSHLVKKHCKLRNTHQPNNTCIKKLNTPDFIFGATRLGCRSEVQLIQIKPGQLCFLDSAVARLIYGCQIVSP